MSFNQHLKQRILNAIHQAQDKGYTLICEHWGSSQEKCACALGCVAVAEDKPISTDGDQYAPELEVSTDWVYSFLGGFDNNQEYIDNVMNPDPEAWQIGFQVRQETKPIPYDEFEATLGKDDE